MGFAVFPTVLVSRCNMIIWIYHSFLLVIRCLSEKYVHNTYALPQLSAVINSPPKSGENFKGTKRVLSISKARNPLRTLTSAQL